MSERCSFITEYIYCPKCVESIRSLFARPYKYWDIVQIKTPTGDLPIFAGKIGAVGPAEVGLTLLKEVEETNIKLCHPIRAAILKDVLTDTAASEAVGIYILNPDGSVERSYLKEEK